MPRAALAVTAVLVGLAFARPAAASPQDLFGFGVRSPAMGMTGVSFADDYEATYLNPAGLAGAKRRSLVLGFHAGVYQVDVDDGRFPISPSRGAIIGFTLPMPFGGFLEDRLTFGGGFYTPADALLKGRVSFAQVPQFLVIDRAEAAAVQVGLGVDLDDALEGLRAGVGVTATADVTGDLVVFLDETNAFSSSVESQLVAAYAPLVGAQLVRERWGAGLVFRGELVGRMDLAVAATDLPIEIPVLRVGGVVHYDPPTVVAEGHYRLRPDLMLVGQLTTRLWGAYPGPQQKTSSGSNLAPDPDFATTLAPRLGVEWADRDGSLGWAVRGGYAYEPSPSGPARMAPVRDRNGDPTSELVPARYLDNDRHVLSAGVGASWALGRDRRLRFDLYGQLQLLTPREHEIGRREGASPMETDGRIFVGGWAMGLEF